MSDQTEKIATELTRRAAEQFTKMGLPFVIVVACPAPHGVRLLRCSGGIAASKQNRDNIRGDINEYIDEMDRGEAQPGFNAGNPEES
jgi:hypothetical protein